MTHPANPKPLDTPTAPLLNAMVDGLQHQGYVVCDHAIAPTLLQALQAGVTGLPQDAFHSAGIGRAQGHSVQSDYRSDRIHWLQPDNATEARWLNWANALREHVNQHLFMGLQSYEAHFAHYAPGQFYKRHVDAFRGQANRVLSTVLYLNPTWSEDDGGELVLYPTDATGQESIVRVTPSAGRLVVFLAEELAHEVLPAHRDRYSIAGWFRVRSNHMF